MSPHHADVTINAIGVQQPRARFLPEAFSRGLPWCHPWRMNLTALSQVYNLYIVAYRGEINCYEPKFPNQELMKQPSLIIRTPPSAPHLRGHLDPFNPHCANQIVVQHLGTDEILVVVRDDGDVDAYFTRHIWEALERRRHHWNTLDIHATEIRPFLHRNVGNSAWGIAVHTEARIIAISSNNHEFNVFAFALAKDTEDQQDHSTPSREKDQHYRIRNGDDNIPCISFCNTGADPRGRYLLTTDIAGNVSCWDLHYHFRRQGLKLSRDDGPAFGYDRFNSGWGLMFLNPATFHRVDDLRDTATGSGIAGTHGRLAEALSAARLPNLSLPIWDLSKSRYLIPGAQCGLNPRRLHPLTEAATNGVYHPGPHTNTVVDRTASYAEEAAHERQYRSLLHAYRPLRNVDTNLGNFIEWSVSELYRIHPEQLYIDNASHPPRAHHQPGSSMAEVLDSGPPQETNEILPDEMISLARRILETGGPEAQILRETVESFVSADAELAAPRGETDTGLEVEDDQGEIEIENDSEDQNEHIEDEDTEASAHDESTTDDDELMFEPDVDDIDSGRRLVLEVFGTDDEDDAQDGNQVESMHLHFDQKEALCPLPAPVIFTSVHNIYMIQPPHDRSRPEENLPIVMLQDPFEQIESDTHRYSQVDRTCLHAQIPSLGVVIIGNQVGRVVVFSLVKARHLAQLKLKDKRRVQQDKDVYGMKLEAILPFQGQESAGFRPFDALHGIAVGPMQGTENLPDDQKRWRLMLMYQDHTILSYEISKKSPDVSADVEKLVI